MLDLASHDGRWSLAALDAGAESVVGVEARDYLVARARQNFVAYGVEPKRYSFIQDVVPEALSTYVRGSFDIILCLGFLYHTAKHFEVFAQFDRLAPKHVILDTAVIHTDQPTIGFRYEAEGAAAAAVEQGRLLAISGVPSHSMITMLCDYFDFSWQIVDWNTFGIERWEALEDYQHDQRRTYVLTRK